MRRILCVVNELDLVLRGCLNEKCMSNEIGAAQLKMNSCRKYMTDTVCGRLAALTGAYSPGTQSFRCQVKTMYSTTQFQRKNNLKENLRHIYTYSTSSVPLDTLQPNPCPLNLSLSPYLSISLSLIFSLSLA